MGSLVIGQDGVLDNCGLIENYGDAASLVDEWGGLMDGDGVIQYDPAYPLQLAEGASYSVQRFIPFVWGIEAETISVNTEHELRRYAAQVRNRTTLLVDSPIVLTRDLVVTCGLAVPGGCLSVDGGSITLAGEDAFLILDNSDLGGSALTLQEGAAAVLDSVDNCGGLDISGGSTLLVKGGDVTVRGENVDIRDAMLINLGWLHLEDSSLTVNGGLTTSCGLDIINSGVTIGENGRLHSEGHLRFDGGTLDNQGYFGIHGWEWQEWYLGGVIHNRADMELPSNVEFFCEMTNYGTLRLHQGDEDGTLYVYGSLDNQGRITMAEDFMRVRAIDGGAFTGNQPQYDPDFWN